MSCRDQFFPGVQKFRCSHNSNHIFVSQDRVEYHQPRCDSHPLRRLEREQLSNVEFGEIRGRIEYQNCPFYPFHSIKVIRNDEAETQNLFNAHIAECPRRGNPFNSGAAQDVDRINTELDIAERAERVIFHHRDKCFSVRRVLLPEARVDEKHLFVDCFASYSTSQFPGLLRRTELRDHRDFLVATLHPDVSDPLSSNAFRALYGGMDVNKMGIVYQSAGVSDTIYLIVHPNEPNGFGCHLDKGELGLFRMRHTELLGVPSAFEQSLRETEFASGEMYSILMQLKEQESLNAKLAEEINSSRAEYITRELQWKRELDQERQTNKTLREELASLQRHFLERVEDAKSKALREFAQQELAHIQKVAELQEALDFERREKSTIFQNGEKEKQNVEILSQTVDDLNVKLKSSEAEKLELQERYEALLISSEVKKRGREKGPEMELCESCGEYRKDTVFWPCGHMYYCNVCTKSAKMPVGAKLRHIPCDDRKCPVCQETIRKVGLVFP